MKKIILVLLTLCLGFNLAACGDDKPTLADALEVLETATSYETFASTDMGAGLGMPEGFMIMETTVKLDGDKAHQVMVMKSGMKMDEAGNPVLDGEGNPILDKDASGNVNYTNMMEVEMFVVNNKDNTYDVYAKNELTDEMELTENVTDTDGSLSMLFEEDDLELKEEDFTSEKEDIYVATITVEEDGMEMEMTITIDLTNGLDKMVVKQDAEVMGMVVSGLSRNFNTSTVTLPTIA